MSAGGAHRFAAQPPALAGPCKLLVHSHTRPACPAAGSFYPFVIYTAFATVVATVFVMLPFLVAPSRVDLDKSSAYECGFDAFGEVSVVCVCWLLWWVGCCAVVGW